MQAKERMMHRQHSEKAYCFAFTAKFFAGFFAAFSFYFSCFLMGPDRFALV